MELTPDLSSTLSIASSLSPRHVSMTPFGIGVG
jgi:hypothetical protein